MSRPRGGHTAFDLSTCYPEGEPKFRITFDKKVLKLLLGALGKNEDIVHLQFYDEHGPAVWSVKEAGKKGAMLPLRVPKDCI